MKRQDIRTYEQAVEYLLNIPRFTSKNTMEDTKAFLERLGNPDRKFNIIHVAGTNGKGSVCAYLRCMLEEAGYSVCAFTSPHLVDVRERFLIRGEMVSREKFLEAFLQVYDRIPWEEPAGYHPTFFEFLFFMAMLLFEEAAPDYVILETGLGGRLDATNSVSHKELAVITRISLDHVEYLGDTPEKIAAEKAGIIFPGVPVVYTDTSESVSAVFDDRAKKVGAFPCPVSNRDIDFSNFKNKNIDFSLHTRYYNDISLTLRTTARYQMENAALAVRALEELFGGDKITAEQIRAGISRCFWPGRMEEIRAGIYVDGAHNEDGVRAFLESVAQDGWKETRILLFSAVRDKAFEKMLGRIVASGLFQIICLVPLHSGRATKLEVLEEEVRHLLEETYGSKGENTSGGLAGWEQSCPKLMCFEEVGQAVDTLICSKTEKQQIYIAGSLYLAGEVKAYLGAF